MLTLKELFRHSLAGAPSSFEAGELFRFVTGAGPLDDWSAPAPPEMARELTRLLALRAQGYPLQYIVGGWEFYGISLKLGPGVLIPRQDTETLVDIALEHLAESLLPAPTILELGSGSGCIAIAVKKNFPAGMITAVELSPRAFDYLEENIAGSELEITALKADMLEYHHPTPIDLLISNPPYIPKGELPTLQTEVNHEPLMALDGGEDGLNFFRAIARRYKPQLSVGGKLLLEIGNGQQDAVSEILASFGFEDITHHKDLNGVIRVVGALNPGAG